jgi:nucleoside-diphosphate-sugar epimerase
MKVLVTGATGFIGSALVTFFASKEGYEPIAAIRRQQNSLPAAIRTVPVGEINADTNWDAALKDVRVVVHVAARAHVMSDTTADPLDEYRQVNVAGTLNLVRQAIDNGVERLVFISSIKVNGEGTEKGNSYTASDKPQPEDPYGISKLEAELGLQELARESGMEVVIIRPPLVYGPGVKANFHSMMRWLDKGVPLPLGAINNRRSLVAVDNLVDLIAVCIDHPAAANQIFLAGDGEDLSTTALLERLAMAMGKPARLIPVPGSVLKIAAALLGRGDIAQRICGSLQIDISDTRDLLGWEPPVTVDEALRKTAESYINSKGS